MEVATSKRLREEMKELGMPLPIYIGNVVLMSLRDFVTSAKWPDNSSVKSRRSSLQYAVRLEGKSGKVVVYVCYVKVYSKTALETLRRSNPEEEAIQLYVRFVQIGPKGFVPLNALLGTTIILSNGDEIEIKNFYIAPPEKQPRSKSNFVPLEPIMLYVKFMNDTKEGKRKYYGLTQLQKLK